VKKGGIRSILPRKNLWRSIGWDEEVCREKTFHIVAGEVKTNGKEGKSQRDLGSLRRIGPDTKGEEGKNRYKIQT